MKDKVIISGLIVLLVCVGLSGCEQTVLKSDDEKFIGKWICNKELYNYTIIFTQDHKYQSYNHIWGNGLYEVKNGQLVLTMSNSNVVFSIDYTFSNNDQIFTLSYTNGDTLVFTKQ